MKTNREILEFYLKPECIDQVFLCWNEPHRKFHTEEHLDQVLASLAVQKQQFNIDETAWDALVLCAYLHDIVYVPGEKNNEEQSWDKAHPWFRNPKGALIPLVKDLILSTKSISGKKTGLQQIFENADCWGLIHWNFDQILRYEEKIFQEFQRFPFDK